MAYFPESPRVDPPYEPTSPRTTSLLDSKFRPIQYPDDYLRLMKVADARIADGYRNEPDKYNNFVQACVDRYTKFEYNMQRTKHLITSEPKITEKSNIPSTIDHVTVKLSVIDGVVKSRLYADLAVLNERYMSKGKRPPLKPWLKALRRFGYDDKQLMRMIEKYTAENDDDEFLAAIFDKYNTKTKPAKKKTVHKTLRGRK